MPEQSRLVEESGSGGQPRAVLIHDQNSLNESELAEAVAAGGRLTVANARSQAEGEPPYPPGAGTLRCLPHFPMCSALKDLEAYCGPAADRPPGAGVEHCET